MCGNTDWQESASGPLEASGLMFNQDQDDSDGTESRSLKPLPLVRECSTLGSGLVLTFGGTLFSPVFVLLRNAAIRSFPPGGAGAALLPLLPSAAAARRVV